MKKIIGIFIIFSFLFSTNNVFGAVVGCPSCSCKTGGGVYNSFTDKCSYPCNVDGNTKYFYSKEDDNYKQCKEEEKAEINKLEAERERLDKEEKENTYKERIDELSKYKEFFEKVNMNLTLYTSNTQYNILLEKLKEAKANYIKEQENQKKIQELEKRIKILESKSTQKVIIPHNKEETIKPTINNKITEPVIKKEEPKIEIIKENPSVIIEPTDIKETPIVPTNKPILKRIFNWFKSLI